MSEQNTQVIAIDNTQNLASPIGELNQQLEQYLIHIGLPINDVVADVVERKKVIAQISEVIQILPIQDRGKARYLSRFIIAIAAGLFDGAINYLWDETIKALRQHVINFDIQYFLFSCCENQFTV